ncbi:MAG TPA: 30S ribosome-binding factor RbfA [Labilithrix sp.]|nr:30S ribosome-binding factor RbfA [Labilithrix sp.]
MKRESTKKAAHAPRSLRSRADDGRTEASRPVRVAAQLRQEVARLVGRDLADPRLEGLVISNAWISADLRLAKVFFRIATTSEGAELDTRKKDAEKALERASGRVRKAVTARLGLRVAPELRFLYDEGQDARNRIEQLLDEVKRDASKGA